VNKMQGSEEIEKAENVIEKLPAPGGIGMAVAVDWGLAVQTFLTPILVAFGLSNQMKTSGLSMVLSFVAGWLFAGVCVFFGEMVRQGRNWTRWIQIIFNALLSLGGIISLFSLYQSLRVGNFWPLVTEFILVIISPLIVWRMTRSSTARWFKAVTVAEASKRHGGKWVWFIALLALIGGILQTFAAMSR
jgi:predicted membrane-bound dolichyl-phosphate-mannose-protein mannosyltransferase